MIEFVCSLEWNWTEDVGYGVRRRLSGYMALI